MNRESKRILIVDDEKDLRDLFADMLTLGGHQISTASNAFDAFAILRNGLFDLVISDVNMPNIDGPHFYMYAVEEHPYLKDRFLFVTCCVTEEFRDFLKRFDLNCMEKPLKLADFSRQVNMLLMRPFHGSSNLDKAVGCQKITA
ncbi:MAG: response regulator [Deltaproteobacteria bacterium]|nr:response regulator [Deltaproteobacteria bacterium]